MKKLLTLFIVAMIAMMGTAYAMDAQIYNADGTQQQGDPIIIQPGQTLTFSIYLDDMNPSILNNSHPYEVEVYDLGGGAQVSDMTVNFANPTVTPTADPFTDVAAFTVTLDENAPATGQWQIVINVGEKGTPGLQFASATRNVEIPEFPTIALPIAAILGLAFFMQRRNREE